MLKYGHSTIDLNLPNADKLHLNLEKNILNQVEIIKNSIKNPINNTPLRDMCFNDKKICIIISDITRSWQNIDVFLPIIIDEMKLGGAHTKNINILCATGSHRKHTENEKKALLGNLYGNINFVEHDCTDESSMRNIGTTSNGTPVTLNTLALDCDFLMICSGMVFHELAGFSGGRKSILPGISSYESIMKNHSLSLTDSGLHPDVLPNNYDTNPVSLDMEEAFNFIKVDYFFTVVVDDDIVASFSGMYKPVFHKTCEYLKSIALIPIDKLYDIVIASSGGYPFDMNLYQGTKAFTNSKYAAKPFGTIILLCEASEGFGHPDMEYIMCNFDNLESIEEHLRTDFTIAKFIAYLTARYASKYNFLLVTDMESTGFELHNIKTFKNLDDALKTIDDLDSKSVCIIEEGDKILPFYNS